MKLSRKKRTSNNIHVRSNTREATLTIENDKAIMFNAKTGN